MRVLNRTHFSAALVEFARVAVAGGPHRSLTRQSATLDQGHKCDRHHRLPARILPLGNRQSAPEMRVRGGGGAF